MVSVPSSSSRPHGPLPGDWGSCSVSRPQLSQLETQGYLPASDLTSTRPGLTSAIGKVFAENFLAPRKEERVCFVPFLLWGLGFPVHPFLWGRLEFYGIQLHNLTPGSILHISGFLALCEIFLSCEAHFDMWRKYLCLVPHTRKGSMFEVGRTKVWRIARTRYPIGTA